jgi:hypothetical protein
MRCLICNTSFCWTSFGGPAEPCDCGCEFTRDAWQSPGGDERYAELSAWWARLARIDAYLATRARRNPLMEAR